MRTPSKDKEPPYVFLMKLKINVKDHKQRISHNHMWFVLYTALAVYSTKLRVN